LMINSLSGFLAPFVPGCVMQGRVVTCTSCSCALGSSSPSPVLFGPCCPL
jgi:hypothetical protein